MQIMIIFSVLIAIAALVVFASAIRHFVKRQLLSGSGRVAAALGFVAISSVLFVLASNLYTYQRLIYERPVADVSFEQVQPQQFLVTIRQLDSGEVRTFELHGDEWQLDAQVLAWKGFANLLGMDAVYRLHRLSGRYLDIAEERHAERSVYSLISPHALDAGVAGRWVVDDWTIDVWELAHSYNGFLDVIDAAYGSAVFLPMSDGARFEVAIARSGLVARPVNTSAKKAISKWIGL